MCRLLTEAGVEVDRKSTSGRTALEMACNAGHLEIVQILIESGADKHLGIYFGLTPLASAARAGRLPVVRWLVEEAKVDLEKTAEDGSTALIMAVSEGKLEVVSTLTAFYCGEVQKGECCTGEMLL